MTATVTCSRANGQPKLGPPDGLCPALNYYKRISTPLHRDHFRLGQVERTVGLSEPVTAKPVLSASRYTFINLTKPFHLISSSLTTHNKHKICEMKFAIAAAVLSAVVAIGAALPTYHPAGNITSIDAGIKVGPIPMVVPSGNAANNATAPSEKSTMGGILIGTEYSRLDPGSVAGIVVGTLVVLLIVVYTISFFAKDTMVCCWIIECCCFRNQRRQKKQSGTNNDVELGPVSQNQADSGNYEAIPPPYDPVHEQYHQEENMSGVSAAQTGGRPISTMHEADATRPARRNKCWEICCLCWELCAYKS